MYSATSGALLRSSIALPTSNARAEGAFDVSRRCADRVLGKSLALFAMGALSWALVFWVCA